MTDTGAAGGVTNVDTIRSWLSQARTAMLCTTLDDARAPGFPFGTPIPYALDNDGNIIIVVSDLAVHTKNLRVDPRASIAVADPRAEDPQTSWRVTVVGTMRVLHGDDAVVATEAYRRRHPASSVSSSTHGHELPGFNPWVLDVKAVRYIAGFGRMGWL